MIILIPAYKPDERLLQLVRDIRAADAGVEIVLVDDGSGAEFAPVFAGATERGCRVLGHEPNRGKGYALKKGFAFIGAHFAGHDVVCADSDGQHLPADILRVGAQVERRSDTVVLGVRRFGGAVPIKSRLGNEITRVVFLVATGLHLRDTQTGLRGYPAEMLGWLATVPGDRFEYEMSVLLEARKAGFRIAEVPIETVYFDNNAATHFRPLPDSVRVYAPVVRFTLSSIVAFFVDLVLVLALKAMTGNLLLSVVAARAASSVVNFVANRRLVFRRGDADRVGPAAAKYYALAGIVLAANYALLRLLTEAAGLALLPAKLIAEAALFGLSYLVQKRHVFKAGECNTAEARSVVIACHSQHPAAGQHQATTSGATETTSQSHPSKT